MRYCFDTSALNQLLDDPDSKAIALGLTATGEFRITAFNVAEIAATEDQSRRTALLKVTLGLMKGSRFLDRPNTIIRRLARAFQQRQRTGNVSIRLTGDEGLEGLWEALNQPEIIDDQARRELISWITAWESEFDQIVAGQRVGTQRLLKRIPENRRTASETIRAYLRHKSLIRESVVGPIYARETGAPLSESDFESLLVEPAWALYLSAYAYGIYNRSVKLKNFSRRKVAGAFDLGQAIYLRFCDRFVTHDGAQYRALRLLNRLNARGQTEVVLYETFRKRLLPPSLAIGGL